MGFELRDFCWATSDTGHPEWAKQVLSLGCSLQLAVAALLGGSYTKRHTVAVISNYTASTYKI